MSENVLRELLGAFAYSLVKPYLRNVRITIDAERRRVRISRPNTMDQFVSFEQMEKVVNEWD